MPKSPEELRAIIAAAKAKIAAKNGTVIQAVPAATEVATAAHNTLKTVVVPSISHAQMDMKMASAGLADMIPTSWTWNQKQQEAITRGTTGQSFVLIGAAGTGKTTTLRGLLKSLIDNHAVPMLEAGTEYLRKDSPGICLLSFTRRAVRNIAKQMPQELKDHCLTFHKILEFGPEYYEVTTDEGNIVNKMRFVPARHYGNPLPENLRIVVVDESSMVDLELFDKFLEALPSPSRVQFIFLGDLNQLPPVYGHPILGQKLLQLPVVELTDVYRQALESPIISLALAVKNNKFSGFNKDVVDIWTGDLFRKEDGRPHYMGFDACHIKEKIVIERPGRGKITLHPWKRRFETEIALQHMQGKLKDMIDKEEYDPEQDIILCPWDKSFGAIELNKAVADKLAKQRGATVFHVVAGFKDHYLAIGDKVLVDKQDAIIEDITRNPRYLGRPFKEASIHMDRDGDDRGAKKGETHLDENYDVDDILDVLVSADDGEKVNQASHLIKVRMIDTGDEETLSTAGELNAMSFGYAITVHKAQGSEWRRVILVTHYCHSAMCFRELIYTAITRASEELYMFLSPMMLEKAAKNARIKGDTLADKLEFYRSALKERLEYQK